MCVLLSIKEFNAFLSLQPFSEEEDRYYSFFDCNSKGSDLKPSFE